MCSNTEIPVVDTDIELTPELVEELTNGKGEDESKE
jgi:hypothetical protein